MSDQTREQEIQARAEQVTASIAQMMARRGGDGACEVCGCDVPARRVGSTTIYARQCTSCVDAERGRELDEHISECLELWRRNTGVTHAQVADILQHGVEFPASWRNVRGGELPCAAILIGPTGTGKTTMGLAWMRHLAERAIRHEVSQRVHLRRYAPRMAYAREDALGIELRGPDRHELLRRWVTADVAFLDDYGAYTPPAYHEDYIGHILMERHAARRITIIASNHRPTELMDSADHPHITDRVIMRLAEMTAKAATLHTLERPWRVERMSDLRDELIRGGM